MDAPPSVDASLPPSAENRSATRTERFDLQALYETSRLLSASLDLDFVLENLLLTALSKLLVMRGAVLLWRPAEGGYRVAATKGGLKLKADAIISLDEASSQAAPSDGDSGGEPMRGGAVPGALRERGIVLALPLQRGEQRLGLLALGAKATGAAFREAEVEFVTSLVDMSAAAVANALLVEELQEANRDLDGKIQELNTLFDLSQEFNATLEADRLAKLLSFALMGQMAVRRHLFLLRQSGTDEDGTSHPFQVVVEKGASGVKVTPALTEAVCGRRELVRLNDEHADEDEGAEEEGAPWQPLREAGLEVVLPIRHQEETCAALVLGPKMTGKPYAADDIEFLYALGNLAFTSLQNAHLVEEQIEMERLEKEVRLARDAQERLLPQALPAVDGVEIAARAMPSREVGGDYYDVMTLPGDAGKEHLLLALADVTGKGVPASLLMANLQAALQALVPTGVTLDDLAARLNRVVCGNTDMGTFITFFAAVYDPAARTLEYVNAGHNPPMLVRREGTVEELETGGLLLGVMSGADYERGAVQLEGGDVLAIFTDGAPEAMSPDHEEFGEDRLEAFLREHRDQPADAILESTYDAIETFADHPPYLSDDLTMIVLKVKG